MLKDTMAPAKREARPKTPVDFALQLLGGKWKPLIVYHLEAAGRLRFGELGRRMPGITQKMLTQQLRDLEGDGLVRREVFAQVPPRVEYSLTELGQKAKPVMEQLCAFGRTVALATGVRLGTCTLAPEAKGRAGSGTEQSGGEG